MEDPTRDAPKVFSMERSGFKVNFERKDPYGFIYMFLDIGDLPDKYRGVYTHHDAAVEAATEYFTEMEMLMKKTEELTPKKVQKVA